MNAIWTIAFLKNETGAPFIPTNNNFIGIDHCRVAKHWTEANIAPLQILNAVPAVATEVFRCSSRFRDIEIWHERLGWWIWYSGLQVRYHQRAQRVRGCFRTAKSDRARENRQYDRPQYEACDAHASCHGKLGSARGALKLNQEVIGQEISDQETSGS